ncbi:MAG: AsmA-like C-terminal domain-containing protein [Sulfurimonas sp.]|nr:AsmA-like C-terminal domain-containing protein [Sulfurimonas sp.]
MNDKIIINTISKIHFILISALSFILLILFTIFILLQNGIYLDDISLQNIKVKKLYIKWDEKISVVAKELYITEHKKREKTIIDYNKIVKIIEKDLIFSSWFSLIDIDKIFFNDIKGSFKYIDNKKGFLSLSSPDFMLKSSFYSEKKLFKIQINELRAKQKDIKAVGGVVFNLNDGLKFATSLTIDINNDAKLHLQIKGDTKKLSYKLSSEKKIKDTRYIVDIFDIDPRAKYWFYDAMELSSLSIQSVDGWLEYKNIDKAYLNLQAKAVANDLIYTYDKKVDSVRTSHTDLEFKNGVLFIKPKNAYSYDFPLDKSWLKIDFSKKEELLTLYLLFKGQANRDLLRLLDRYNIKLPFIQTKGKLDTNLKLLINLISADVTALGDFYTKEAQINYLGLDIDIFDANISINNTHVKVDNMFAKYKDIATSHVDLDFDAKNHSGTLDFRVESIFIKDNDLKLKSTKEPLHVKYIISPIQDFVEVDKSIWELKDKSVKIDAMRIPFMMKELTAYIPVTFVEVQALASAYISGEILFKPNRANLDIDLLKLNYNDITLGQSITPLKLSYNKKLTVSSENSIRLNIGSKTCQVQNAVMEIQDKTVSLKNIKLNIGNIIKSEISAKYAFDRSIGFIDMHNIQFSDAKFGEIFNNNRNVQFHILNKNNKTTISSKAYDLEYIFSDKEWVLKLNSIKKIAKNSNILKKYDLNNGSFSFHKKSNEKDIKFSANIKYKYKVLAANNKPIDNYIIDGKIDNDTDDIHLNINNSVYIQISDDIKIQADNIGININEIVNMFSDRNSTEKTKEKISVHFDAKNCFIYLSENRYIVSDEIKLQYFDDILTAQLKYKKGNAGFKFNKNNFHLYGKGFNDKFMEKLFALSKFKGGSLDFSISGTTKEYGGIIYAKNTTIKEYKILNNILAFVNTIPSLVTFSLPGYNKNGLFADSAYINFKFKDDIYKMSDISLHSKEIDIVGFGEASTKKNTIDLELNLKTDLGSSFSKIPLVGYILMGKENISSSLTVTGALDNPDVNTQIAKSIIVAPLNIIKRTLLLPFELFKSKDEKDK